MSERRTEVLSVKLFSNYDPRLALAVPITIHVPAVVIDVYEKVVSDDPKLTYWNVVLQNDNAGCWTETFGSQEARDAFILGVRAGSVMQGKYIPDVNWLEDLRGGIDKEG